jgi:hypothetical protein
LERLRGTLIDGRTLHAATVKCGEVIVAVVDRLPMAAEELAGVAARDGIRGLRAALIKYKNQQRSDISAALAKFAAVDTEGDE